MTALATGFIQSLRADVSFAVAETYEEMSERAASILMEMFQLILQEKEKLLWVPSAGKTPLRLYELLSLQYRETIDWRRIILFQMDDYLGLPAEHPVSFAAYLKRHLIEPLHIEEAHFIGKENEVSLLTLEAYEGAIEEKGGIDVALHGIGVNGHIGFNEPGTSFDSPTRIVTLEESTLVANGGTSDGIDALPRCGVTLGLHVLSKAKHNVVVVSGGKKRVPLLRFKNREIRIDLPLSALWQCPVVRVVADREALGHVE